MVHTFLSRSKKALAVFGLWIPPQTHSIWYVTYRSIQISLQYSLLILNFVYMGMIWGDLEEISEGLYILFTQATLCLKTTTFIINVNTRLEGLLKFIESDVFVSTTERHKEIIEAQKQKMWRGYLFFLLVSVVNCVEWGMDPLVHNKHIRRFPFKIWMPADPNRSPDYEIGYTYQMLVVCMSPLIFFTIDYFTISMITFAAAQLEIISEKIKTIQTERLRDNKISKQEHLAKNNAILIECITQHQSIIRFIKLVENMFNLSIFFQMSCTVLIICIICLRITIEPRYTMHFYSTLNYLVAMLSQLFVYCWCGDELTNQSELLREVLYDCPWQEQDDRFKKALWITMEYMKRPIIFRAGYYIPLSRPTFVSILRCSYSYFAVLNQAK